ncbi:hypothetical protein U1Q18_006677 [Sarracenia purpurea var. burkii]
MKFQFRSTGFRFLRSSKALKEVWKAIGGQWIRVPVPLINNWWTIVVGRRRRSSSPRFSFGITSGGVVSGEICSKDVTTVSRWCKSRISVQRRFGSILVGASANREGKAQRRNFRSRENNGHEEEVFSKEEDSGNDLVGRRSPTVWRNHRGLIGGEVWVCGAKGKSQAAK